MIFSRRHVQNKRFSYEPRYYDPAPDENLRQRFRIKGKKLSRRQSPVRLLVILALLVLAVYIFLNL